jgi:hypothetical protein
MASNSKKILDDSLEGENPLGLASRFESRLVGDVYTRFVSWAGLLTTGWVCSSGSPNEWAQPTGQLTGGQARLNRVRTLAFVSPRFPLY